MVDKRVICESSRTPISVDPRCGRSRDAPEQRENVPVLRLVPESLLLPLVKTNKPSSQPKKAEGATDNKQSDLDDAITSLGRGRQEHRGC